VTAAKLRREFLADSDTDCSEHLFVDMSKFDHALNYRSVILDHGRIEDVTREEFVSLLLVGNTCAVLEQPALIPAEHSARLIALGYMMDLSGRLRMTTPGRRRMAAKL
jgi:hypothetical protein